MPFPTQLPAQIQTVEDLQDYLLIATQLEHATLPIYFTALYSINQKTNSDAYHILRVVAVEEMLHLAQSANLLIAVGGAVKFTDPGFVAQYPTPLPDGEQDFYADLQSFSPAAVSTFLQIERPNSHPNKKTVPVTAARTAARALSGAIVPSISGADGEAHFYSIGDFYDEIANGIQRLHNQLGDALFSHNVGWQISGEDYYSGGGKLTVVTDLASALDAINRIIYQGEGKDGGIYTKDGELSHYYRFKQLKLGAFYTPEDTDPEAPSGPKINVDWFDVVQVKTNISLADFKDAPELQQLVKNFINTYADFLNTLQNAFSGQPDLLQKQAVPKMFQLKNDITNIINNPLPSHPGLNAGPLFKG
jgi:hypothetical protein